MAPSDTRTNTVLTGENALIAAHKGGSLFTENGFEGDRIRALPESTVKTLHDNRLFLLLTPRKWSGSETPLPEAMAVFDELARADQPPGDDGVQPDACHGGSVSGPGGIGADLFRSLRGNRRTGHPARCRRTPARRILAEGRLHLRQRRQAFDVGAHRRHVERRRRQAASGT